MNVDYVVLSSLRNAEDLEVVISYDINCQYSINFFKRLKKMKKLYRRMFLKHPPG